MGRKNGKVTIREVAARAGVSISTVSRVLNGCDVNHMRPETKERVLRAIEELGYTPLKVARALRRQRTQLIAILVPDISNPFFSLLARGVASVAFENKYSTLICDSNHSFEKECKYLDILRAEGVEGIVFIPVGRPDMDRVERLTRQGIKIVVADRRVEGLPVVEADNRGGSRKLTQYVLNLGYRRIAYIAGPKEVSTAQDRLAGFLEVMRTVSISPVVVIHGNFTYESGYVLAKRILTKEQVEVIMCGNDLIAIGVIRAAEELGLRVPQDLGVTGFDHIPFYYFVRPRLTTVAIPVFELGKMAFNALLSDSNESIVVKVDIVLGDTIVPKGGESGQEKTLLPWR